MDKDPSPSLFHLFTQVGELRKRYCMIQPDRTVISTWKKYVGLLSDPKLLSLNGWKIRNIQASLSQICGPVWYTSTWGYHVIFCLHPLLAENCPVDSWIFFQVMQGSTTNASNIKSMFNSIWANYIDLSQPHFYYGLVRETFPFKKGLNFSWCIGEWLYILYILFALIPSSLRIPVGSSVVSFGWSGGAKNGVSGFGGVRGFCKPPGRAWCGAFSEAWCHGLVKANWLNSVLLVLGFYSGD